MYYNPSYMNPIMQGLNKEPLEGIASLAPQQPTQPTPTQPSQPLDPQMTPPPGGIQPITQDNIQGGIEQPNEIGNQIIQPRQPSLPFDIAPITPYVQNENLDLTNRGSIMEEYNKYIQGGMGSRAHTMDVRGGFSFMGEDLAPGSSTGFGDFRKFLDTYGIGDRLQFDDTGVASLADYQLQQNTGPGI